MTDDQQAQQNPAGNPEAPMPSAEQVPSNEAPVQEVAPQEVPSAQSESEGLPDGVSERTRRNFEEMREQLREERMRRERLEQAFSAMNQPKQEPVAPIYDPETGVLNEGVFTDIQRRTWEAEQRALRAETAVQDYQRLQEEREAFTAHPELEPNKKGFDKTLHNLTRSILTDAMLNPQDYGNKQLSFKEAADLAKSISNKALTTARQEGAQQALEQLTPKEQAALEATGTPSRRAEVSNNSAELQYKTRKGDANAIVERLQGVGWK